jgi:hypothetical protein
MQNFQIDWSIAPLVLATSGTDANIQIPFNTPLNFTKNMREVGSWYLMGVAGNSCYINTAGAATSANLLHPIGRDDSPKLIEPGTTFHALASTGTGQLWFLRCYPTLV